MKILCLTSMYPLPKAPYSGVFITYRVESLRSIGCEVIPVAVVHQESLLMRGIRKLLGKNRTLINNKILRSHDNMVDYHVVGSRVGIFRHFLDYVTHGRYSCYHTANKILKIYGNMRADIVVAHWLYPNGRIAELVAEKLGVPCVITCHGSDINIEMANPATRDMRLMTLRKASCVEFVSNALLNKAKSFGYDDSNYVIRPNGIVQYKSKDSSKVKNDLCVGFVGGLLKVKRADVLIDIYSHISALTDKHIHYLVVGQGPEMDGMQNKAESLQINVEFTGGISPDCVHQYMDQMDVMLLPSRNEGWPCVVLEAHARGVIVVGSSNGGIPEAIGDDRLIVDESEDFIEKFSERVVAILNDAIHIDKDLIVNRSKLYTWEKLQSGAVTMYKDLIENHEE